MKKSNKISNNEFRKLMSWFTRYYTWCKRREYCDLLVLEDDIQGKIWCQHFKHDGTILVELTKRGRVKRWNINSYHELNAFKQDAFFMIAD